MSEWHSLLRVLSYMVKRTRGNTLYVTYRDVYKICIRLNVKPPSPYKLHKLMKTYNVQKDCSFIRGGKVTWILRKNTVLWKLLEESMYTDILAKIK
ncbi:MAG: hypothetical protein DRN04_10780 [Thermoprotei archaeon]|nr:MAG: hypothetical protein DRN04_10780 [Thermoprotei archaeon]